MQPQSYFSAGPTLATMVNIETVIDEPTVLDGGRIPLLGPVKTRLSDSSARRDGKINVNLKFDVPLDTGRIALNTFLFGDQGLAGKELYVSALDEFNFYSPYLVYVDRPYEQQDYTQALGGAYVQALVLPLINCRLQVLVKTADYTVTPGDHSLKGDTSSGTFTFSLPPLASVNDSVVYSFHKLVAANSLVLDGDGSETIDSATTKTLTALGARIDLIKRSGQWKTVRSGSMV